MIVFSNQAELELEFLNTMGLSVKESRSPIGRFGTGLKYSIAVILRHGQTIKFQIGKSVWHAFSKAETLRGQVFQRICLIEEGTDTITKLPFSLDYGKHWHLEHAYRELYSNMLDEGGGVSKTHDPNFSGTQIIVEGSLFDAVHENRNEFLLSADKLLTSTHKLEIWAGSSSNLFYRGIAVLKLPKPSLFTYNITGELELTEDRTVQSYIAESIVASEIAACQDRGLIKQIILSKDFWEEALSFEYYSLSTSFEETARAAFKENVLRMNASVMARVIRQPEKPVEFKEVVMSNVQESLLKRAMGLLEPHAEVSKYPIKLCETLGEKILARAYNGEILLTQDCFKGIEILMETLYEEFLHLNLHLQDYTRQMQDHLFSKIIRLILEAENETT